MKKDLALKNIISKTTLVFFAIFVLVAIFIYKSFFRSMGDLMFFLIATFLIGIFWNKRKSWLFKYLAKKVNNFPYWNMIFALAQYCLIYLSAEFFITEVWFKTPKIPSFVGITVLLLFCLANSLVGWQNFIKRLQPRAKTFFLVLAFVHLCFSVFIYSVYRNEKLAREHLPKIYGIFPPWGLQAQTVTIQGVNFGPSWKGGRVVLGREEWTVKSWKDTEIIAEQPVSSHFGISRFLIIRKDNIVSNHSLPYEEKDPSTMK